MTLARRRSDTTCFASINPGYNAVFARERLSLGLVVPIEAYPDSPVPTMRAHIERVRLAEALGYAAVWLRDVPFNVPAFGDAGQTFDPFVYLGALAAQTETIALGVASLILPLRHPAHVAKAASSVDVLSDGRLILGIASGDRPEEYPAMAMDYATRSARFRDAYDYVRHMAQHAPEFDNSLGRVDGTMDLLPKPVAGALPLLVTGLSQQSPEWCATHADGWITYPRPAPQQAGLIQAYRQRVADAGAGDKPVMEPLYIDLLDDPRAPPQPIHLGLRLGTNALRDYLTTREAIGVNHVALNLRFNRGDIEQTLRTLADSVLPHFTIETSI